MPRTYKSLRERAVRAEAERDAAWDDGFETGKRDGAAERDELRAALAAIAVLHEHTHTEETDTELRDGEWHDIDPIDVIVCDECGYDNDGEYPLFRRYPCPTLRAVHAVLARREGTDDGN